VTSARQQAAQRCAAVLDEKFFKAFSEPARAAVFQQVVLLGCAEIKAIAECLPQDRSVVSRHLQVLADAGVLKARKDGRRTLYEVNAAEIERRLIEMLELTRQLRAAEGACPG
jgi:DNA-binding transcriptional ArsR family regulator